MNKTIYILNLTPIADNNRVLAFTDKRLAEETMNKAVERMKALYPKLTTVKRGEEIYFYEDGQLCQDIVFRLQSVPLMSEIYPAVETTYFDEFENRQVVDAWPTTDEWDENGRSAATIEPNDKIVSYKEDTHGENCVNVYNSIEDWALAERLGEEKEIAEQLSNVND